MGFSQLRKEQTDARHWPNYWKRVLFTRLSRNFEISIDLVGPEIEANYASRRRLVVLTSIVFIMGGYRYGHIPVTRLSVKTCINIVLSDRADSVWSSLRKRRQPVCPPRIHLPLNSGTRTTCGSPFFLEVYSVCTTTVFNLFFIRSHWPVAYWLSCANLKYLCRKKMLRIILQCTHTGTYRRGPRINCCFFQMFLFSPSIFYFYFFILTEPVWTIIIRVT